MLLRFSSVIDPRLPQLWQGQKSGIRGTAECVTDLLTTSGDPRQLGIYLFFIIPKQNVKMALNICISFLTDWCSLQYAVEE